MVKWNSGCSWQVQHLQSFEHQTGKSRASADFKQELQECANQWLILDRISNGPWTCAGCQRIGFSYILVAWTCSACRILQMLAAFAAVFDFFDLGGSSQSWTQCILQLGGSSRGSGEEWGAFCTAALEHWEELETCHQDSSGKSW